MRKPSYDAADTLTQEWTGPYGGVPPFDKIEITGFKPALELAMAEHLREVERVANNPASPTFENTFVALERSGEMLARVTILFSIWTNNLSSPELQTIDEEMQPRLAAHYDKITQNTDLFRRIEAIYNSLEKQDLAAEQQRLVWVCYHNYVHAGAKLDAELKEQLSQVNQQLAALYSRFSANLLADEADKYVVINKESDLSGLPASLKNAAAQDAAAKGLSNSWVIRNTRSSVETFLAYADNRDLREKVWRMFITRGDNNDTNDNKAIIADILPLRAQQAQLLGFPTHAHWKLDLQMAKNPEAAMDLMEQVWPAAIARVKEEVADIQKLAEEEHAGITIEPWDYCYYMEKVRKAKYDLDENDIRPYLELDNIRGAMFWVAGELFGFSFSPVTNVPVFHPDVRVFEVSRKETSEHVGLWYFDPYSRDGKRSGAWMNQYRDQQKLKGTTSIVSNNSNFIKAPTGEPDLISWDDAVTMFHEFGHALHGLASEVTHPSLSGANVATDFVEFPSQLLEHWLSTPEVLQRFARHYQTGEPIPQELVDKIHRASKFNQGFGTTEYLSSALVDMKLHLDTSDEADINDFEKQTLASLGMPREVVMRHRLPQFGHLFASDHYSAGYYSYLWADVLTADAFEAFTEAGGPYDRDVAARLLKHIFSAGNTIDPAEAYRRFRGKDPDTGALMRKRGFPEM